MMLSNTSIAFLLGLIVGIIIGYLIRGILRLSARVVRRLVLRPRLLRVSKPSFKDRKSS